MPRGGFKFAPTGYVEECGDAKRVEYLVRSAEGDVLGVVIGRGDRWDADNDERRAPKVKSRVYVGSSGHRSRWAAAAFLRNVSLL